MSPRLIFTRPSMPGRIIDLSASNVRIQNPLMPGPVEAAIRKRIPPRTRLPTPTGRAEFVVDELGPTELILLLGAKHTRTAFTWACLEGAAEFLRGRGWIRVGANRDIHGDPMALDGYRRAASNARPPTMWPSSSNTLAWSSWIGSVQHA